MQRNKEIYQDVELVATVDSRYTPIHFYSPLVEPHRYIVANIVEERSSEPLERLTPVLLPAPLGNVKRVCNRQYIHCEKEEVNSVKQFVWNRVTKVRRSSHEQEASKNAVAGDHDFRRKLITKYLLPLSTRQAKEDKEDNCCCEDN